MNKIYKFNKYLYVFVFSVISLFVFLFDYAAYDTRFLFSDSAVINFFTELRGVLRSYDTSYVALWLFILYFYFNVYFDGKRYDSKSKMCSILSFLFAVLTIVGKSYSIDNTLDTIYSSYAQIFKTVVFVIGYYLIYYAVLKKIFNTKFDLKKCKKKNIIFREINEHPFRTSFILIFLMWLPTLIIAFPGIATGDTTDQLGQFFHTDDSWSINSINLLNEDIYINKHHSVFHTVILGSIIKLGKELVSFTFGAGIYNILQVGLLLVVFSFMIKYMRDIKINSLIIFLSILFIGLNPTIITYAVCAIKDIPSAAFNLLYVIFLLQIVRDFDSIYKNKLRVMVLLLVILLTILLRNNGIYTVMLSFPWLFLVYKNSWKKLLLTLLVPIAIFGLYDKVLLPSFDISDGSIREVLSLPMMQLSRVIRDKGEVFTDKDKEIINKVYDFDVMRNSYNPDIADDIKDSFNKDASDEDLKLFFGVWFKYLKKYPMIYVESVVNSTYGYFLPGKNTDKLYLNNYWFWNASFFDIKNISVFSGVRKVVNELLYIYYMLPIFINNVAYYDLLLIFSGGYLIRKKKYKYLIPLSALFAVLLSCIASPLNGSFRYILPIVFSVPIIVSIDYLVYRECKGNE